MPLCCSSCPHSYRCPFLHLNTLILKAFAFASTRLSQKWKYSPQATEKLYKKMKHILWLKNQTKQIKNCWDFAKCTLRQIYLKYWVYVCLMVLHTWSTMNLWDVLIQSVNKNETHYTKKILFLIKNDNLFYWKTVFQHVATSRSFSTWFSCCTK